MRQKGVVKHTSTVEPNVGQHEHHHGPNPSEGNAEVRGEGEQYARDGTHQGEDSEPPNFDHSSVGNHAERGCTNGNEEGPNHHGKGKGRIGGPFTTEEFS